MKSHTFKVVSNVLIFTSIAILCSSSAVANVIRVPQDQPSIQAGIDASVNGDTVLVEDNTYYENINFKGKSITVASLFVVDGDTNHINNTIINGSQPSHPDSGSVVYFISGEDTSSVLTGFTITGGKGTTIVSPAYKDKDGGGILIRFSGAKIEKNKIVNNDITAAADTFAGGTGIFASSDVYNLVIRGNIISNNSGTVTGDGQAFAAVIVSTKETCILENNHIINNVLHAPNSSAFAAGLMLDGWDNQTGNYIVRKNIIRNNKFNTDNAGGGGVVIQNCSPLFCNNIVSENAATSWGGGGVWVIHFKFAENVVAPAPLIINNTIINNSTTGIGGGILVRGTQSEAYLMNNIIWGNSGSTGPQIGVFPGAGIKVRYSNVQGGYSGEGNIDEDPMLEADSLSDMSPCIGAGTLEYDFGVGGVGQCPSYDFNGKERPYPTGSMPDIGAWESKLDAPTVGIDPQTITGIPEYYTLYQNHPNPFNPTTIIKYTIPSITQSVSVQLEVYDMLGRKVATLVNKKHKPGQYEVAFYAGELTSGIYFYRLTVQSFVLTKKMILMR